MPRVAFTIRWPDGYEQHCESPSRAIEQQFVAGGRYPTSELVRRAEVGLLAASERVRERFGMGCTAAAGQLVDVVAGAGAHSPAPEALCEVGGMVRLLGAPRFPAPGEVSGHREVVVVGGGQAGLSISACLAARGVDHVVLERDRACHSWTSQRWDSFCLVTPNWQCRLPGFGYPGDDPDGFMVQSEIVDYLEAFIARTGPPVWEGIAVREVARAADAGGGYVVATDRGVLTADQVVLAVGGYHVPRLGALADAMPASVTQLHSSSYRNPESLPDGAVLVVGTGQSGAQIAEDLLLAGREVHLCVGSAPRVARFYRGRDCVAWLQDIGHYAMAIEDHPEGLGARREPNHYVTGRDGGRDIDLRAHAISGMRLHGRLRGASDGVLEFADDLEANLDGADATMERIKDSIDRWIAARGIDAPAQARYQPVWQPPPGSGAEPLDLERAGVRSIVWATGFRSDWSWVRVPDAFDADGRPDHVRGISRAEGLHFLGLPWLHTWGSGRFAAIAADSDHLAEAIVAGRCRRGASLAA